MTDIQRDLLESMILRAEGLVGELEQIYTHGLAAQDVSAEALNVTHEIVEKCSNVMDQAMSLFFEREIGPKLTEQPKRGGHFPAARNENSYRSAMGQWKAADIGTFAPELDQKLRSLQPFSSESNIIYARIKELASKKHTALEPQVRQEQRRVNVNCAGSGSVSWGSGVTFGSGVSVMGVPIDPSTQMPTHTQGIDVSVDTWVSFHFKEGGEDALVFCRLCPQAVRQVLKTLFI